MRVNHGLTPQDLKAYGINDVQDIVHNPSYDMLFQEELDPNLEGYERGVLTTLGAIAVDTGIFTGRSPKDKYLVRDDTTRDTVWWSDKGKGKNDNKPLSQETWQHLKGLVTQQLSGKRLFIVDAFCGANADTRLSVRFITEVAWQAHFVKNMFIRPSDEELAEFEPDFIVMNGAKCTNPQWKEQGLNSENFVAFNLTERIQLIGGTWYGAIGMLGAAICMVVVSLFTKQDSKDSEAFFAALKNGMNRSYKIEDKAVAAQAGMSTED